MPNIPLTEIVMGLSSAIDLVSPQMADHHKRVAYIASIIASEMGLPEKDRQQILMAGLLHDCGAIEDEERLRTFSYDFGDSAEERLKHGTMGWQILNRIDELRCPAEIIKYHHLYWNESEFFRYKDADIPLGSYILHVADRVDVLMDRSEEVLQQRPFIRETICSGKGTMFMPDVVDALLMVFDKEYFWFDLISPYIDGILNDLLIQERKMVDMDKMRIIAEAFTGIIDYRSSFTADHSMGVAECAVQLSQKMGLSEIETKMMEIAGLLHDLGKLAIPVEILEKPGPLNSMEFNIMKKHPYYSYRILGRISGFERINEMASFHHERIDGTGYPFKLDGRSLSLGARIMAVSDVFTALTEKRPYRNAMSTDEAIKFISKMVMDNHLDGDVADCLKLNVDEINGMKLRAQQMRTTEFAVKRIYSHKRRA